MTLPRLLTDVQIQEMVTLHAAGFFMRELAAYYTVSESTVRKWLQVAGVDTGHPKVASEYIDEWVELYNTDFTISEIALSANMDKETIRKALLQRGVARKPHGYYRTCTLRENAFDVLTDESAYWIGVLTTDGCIGSTRPWNVLSLILKLSDLDHLVLFRNFLGSNHAICFATSPHPTIPNRTVKSCRLQIHSTHMTKVLAQYGVVPNKTFSLTAKGGVENFRSYWRGVFDGDGTLGVGRTATPFCNLKSASEPFIDQCRAFLKANGIRGEHNIIVEHPGKNSLSKHDKYNLRLGTRAALDAVAFLYTDGVPALARKSQRARSMLGRAINKELRGTIRTNWYDSKAAVWAGLAVQ